MDLEDLISWTSWSSDPIQTLIERVAEWLFSPMPRSPRCRVPSLIGLTVDQARQVLELTGLRIRILRPASEAELPGGRVIAQKPAAGRDVRPRTVMRVRVT